MWTTVGASWHGVDVEALHGLIEIVHFFGAESFQTITYLLL